MSQIIESLYAHMRWADDRALHALQRADATRRQRALDVYAHILGAEHVWLRRMQAVAADFPVWPELDIAQCAALMNDNTEAYRRFIASLSPRAYESVISYVNSAGARFDSTITVILTHVAMHGSYHRGQVAMLLRDAATEPAPTDYIAFTRGAPAAVRRMVMEAGENS